MCLFQAAEEPLQRLPAVFLRQASAYYAKMDLSCLALLAGSLLDEMFETLTPATTKTVNPPKAKVHAAHMVCPLCCGLLLLKVLCSGAGKRSWAGRVDCVIPCIRENRPSQAIL